MRPLRMRSLRLGSAAIVCLGFLVAAPAMADEWGSQDGNTGAHPDEDPHSYCLGSSVSADLEENIDAAAWNALDPTQVNVNYSSTCQLTGAGETDVVWTQGNIASGALAWTDCDDYESDPPTNQCDQNYVRVDLATVNQGVDDEIDQTITTCHEFGHTAGLSHGSTQDDCMENVSTSNPPNALKWRRYSAHHIDDHINPWF